MLQGATGTNHTFLYLALVFLAAMEKRETYKMVYLLFDHFWIKVLYIEAKLFLNSKFQKFKCKVSFYFK